MGDRGKAFVRALGLVWFRPGAAVDIARTEIPEAASVLLAIVGIALQLDGEGRLPLLGLISALGALWTALALVVVVIVGVAGYYVGGFVVHAIARIVGGRGDARSARIALAWSAVPVLAALLVSVAMRAAFSLQVSLVLGNLLAIAGALWALTLMSAMLARVESFGKARGFASALVGQFGFALVVAMVFRSLIFQPFSVPSSSMVPSLLSGDNFFAAKYAYGYDRYSFPYAWPAIEGRWLARAPGLGDVIVFRIDGEDWVKRVVGLPGDVIEMKGDVLIRNGAPVARRPIQSDFVWRDPYGKAIAPNIYEETLADGVVYRIMELSGAASIQANAGPFKVPEDACFVLGDNRDNSSDSRVVTPGGTARFVPFDRIIGRAQFIFYSAEPGEKGAPGVPRPQRFGLGVR